MSKFNCKCGNIIKLSGEIPNADEWLMISDVDFDNYTGSIESEKLYNEIERFFKCPKCERIWFFWKGLNNPPVCYTREN